MRLVVIPDDQKMVKDEVVLKFDFPMPKEIHAVQWDDDVGHIEYNDGTENLELSDISEIQTYIDMFDTEKAKLDSCPDVEPWEVAIWDETSQKWTVNDSPDIVDKKKEALAAVRFERETAGITLQNGTKIHTDRESQALITGAYSASLINPDIKIDWKGENGWVKIGAAEITAIAGFVAEHVQACFSHERVLAELIAQEPDTDITTGWPE